MSACARLRDLGRFFDGETPAEDLEEIRAHLTACAPCQAGLEELLQLDALGHRAVQLKAVELPAHIAVSMAMLELLADEWESASAAHQEGAADAEENAEAIRTLTGWVRQQAGVTRG